ncbi:MAG: electron transfer flavoprotein subunit beta/FixA family protein [Clostridia bacterium]|nr:electron transfer flavoprotein subunit beta/FixA family protein [Clostridia bacterium]
MNLFVLLKQVPGTSNVKMDEKTGTMVRTDHENVINPLDENALEAALELKRSIDGSKITVLSMGPPPASRALREAIAMGADEAHLLCHRGFAGSDTLATARALALAIEHVAGRKLGPSDLVLCGERATDGETGQVGPMISAMLDIAVATYVRGIRVKEGHAVVERVVEEGFERVRIPLPALVTVVKDMNEPGFPTLSGKLAARTAPIPLLTPDDLGLTQDIVGLSGSPTRVVQVFRPKFTRDTVLRQQDSGGAAVGLLVDLLIEKEVI